jgi:hypothetical protein
MKGQSHARHATSRLGVVTITLLGLLSLVPAPARAQPRGVRANPTAFNTYNDVTAAFDPAAEEINLNVNNPGASRYQAITTPAALPPPAQYSFVQTSDGQNIASAVLNNLNQVQNTLPAGAANPTMGGLIDARAWTNANIVMQQCYSGGFAWNMQGSLQAGGGAVVPNNVPYTFMAAANYRELAYEAQAPNINSAATTTLGDFTQGSAWANWNTLALPMNNSTGRYRSYQIGVNGGLVGGVRQGGDPFTANNLTTAWGNTNFFNFATKAFESPVYASSAALGGGVNSNTLNQAAPNPPTYAVLAAFSATSDNRFILDLERQYVALLSDGVPANHIAVLYGNGGIASLGPFTNIAAANQLPNFGGLYANGFTMPVNGAITQANLASYLSGAGFGAAAPAGPASLYFYTTGHGGAVNTGGVPTEVNAVNGGAGVVVTLTLNGPPNPTPITTLQIASNSLLPAAILNDQVSFDGNILPTTLALCLTPFNVTTLANGLSSAQFYYDINIPQSDFTLSGNGQYTLSLLENGSFASSDIQQFLSSLVGVTEMAGDPSLGPSGDVDTFTDLYTAVSIPEPSSLVLMVLGAAAVVALGRRRW